MNYSNSYQKLFKATLATAAATGAIVTVAPTNADAASIVFEDVKEDKFYYESVLDLSTRGIINGYPDGTFKPGQEVTRGEVAQIIALTLGLETENVENPGFKDVKVTDQFYGPIAALETAGIINGFTDQTYRPNAPLTRGQMSVILANAFDLEIQALTDTRFTDVSKSNFYAPYIQALLTSKITAGMTETTFGPNNTVTRGQMAAFISRSLAESTTENFKLSLMHVNDVHASTDKAPKLVTAVNEVRAAKPDALLLNAGDVFSGTLYFNEFKGLADLAFMNLMKVDAMTFGNHEFDLGSSPEGHKALADFIQAANFPFVSANVDFSKDSLFDGFFNTKISSTPENSNIYAGIVKEVDGEKVGIFGLTTAETADIASPGEITFSDYIKDAEKMVAEFEAMGVNKIVALTHIGFDDNAAMDNDQELAKHVDGIDVIVGGHSHTQLDKPVVVDKDKNGVAKDQTIIVQAYQYSDYLGTLDVEFDENGVVIGHAGELIKTSDKEENAEAKEMLKEYADRISEIETEEIGVTLENALETPRTSGDDTKPSVRKNETILGNIITDGMLAKAQEYVKDKKVIMAFQNGGGIRASIEAGPITVGEVITVLPFGNTLATMDITGAEIKEAFELSVKDFPSESGGFLHVSGAKVEFDSSKLAGERIVSISYKNEDDTYTPIEDVETYTVATNAFTAKGGDGYDVLENVYKDGRVTDLGLSDWENLREQLILLKDAIPTEIEGRIVDVAGSNS